MEKTVLVVSDHLALQEGICHGLRMLPLRVRVVQAYNAGQAVFRAVEQYPDLILLQDSILPGCFPMPVPGFEASTRSVCLALLDFFRKREQSSGLPRAVVVVVTCHGLELTHDLESSGLSQACDRIFVVPCLDMLATIKAMLEVKAEPIATSATPVSPQMVPPLRELAVLPPANRSSSRKRGLRKSKPNKQSCIVDLLSGKRRKCGR